MLAYLPSFRKFILTLFALSLPLAAQSGLGIVTGTVTDPSKATVPKASVSLTETARGVVRVSTTNDSGLYYFGSVPVGPYHLMVEAPGFEKWETDFQVQAGQTVTVDAIIAVGNVPAKVEVNDAALQVATQG